VSAPVLTPVTDDELVDTHQIFEVITKDGETYLRAAWFSDQPATDEFNTLDDIKTIRDEIAAKLGQPLRYTEAVDRG
jgi:hypothetical protein